MPVQGRLQPPRPGIHRTSVISIHPALPEWIPGVICQTTPTPTVPWFLPPTRSPDQPILTPTPDAPRIVPTLRQEPDEYTVHAGDTLAGIASRYSVSYDDIAKLNNITDANSVSVGQFLLIPAPVPSGEAPGFKIIPDSEVVYGPMSTTLDLAAFIKGQGGYLATYSEEVDGVNLSGSAIIQKVAEDFSVNPQAAAGCAGIYRRLGQIKFDRGWFSEISIGLF